MKVIEWKVSSKTKKEQLCEDAISISPNYIAVIDGVTAKGKHLWDGKTSGKKATDIIRKSFEIIPADCTAEHLFQFISTQLKKTYQSEIQEEIVEEKLRASVIVYSNFYREIWSYGDCQCRIQNTIFTHRKSVDEMNSMLRAFVIEYEKLENDALSFPQCNAEDVGRNAILPYLKMQFAFENKKCMFGYPVLNGDDIIPEYIKKYSVLPDTEIILATDGYPKVCNTLEESEEYLKQTLKEDPLCICKNRNTKGLKEGNISFDDRAYIRVLCD